MAERGHHGIAYDRLFRPAGEWGPEWEDDEFDDDHQPATVAHLDEQLDETTREGP